VDALSDAEVIGRSIDAPQCFATVFDRHAGVVFRFLVRRVGRDTADELLGDTFRIAFERRATFDVVRPSAPPWLYGIATNLLSRHRRTEARRLRATARLAADRTPDQLADHVAAVVDAGQRWPRVADAIGGLPDAEREVVLLYAWEELSYDEIATELDVPVGTVRSRLNRARRRLRALASPAGDEPATSCGPRGRIEP